MGKAKKIIFNSDETAFEGDGDVEECPICRQEFTGLCPLNSARCPNTEQIEDEAEDDEKESDFDDVKNLGTVLKDDKEAEKLVDDDSELPPEDLEEET